MNDEHCEKSEEWVVGESPEGEIGIVGVDNAGPGAVEKGYVLLEDLGGC